MDASAPHNIDCKCNIAVAIAESVKMGHIGQMLMMNRNKQAKLHFMANGFRMLSSGDHVVCAVSGEKIDLDELRYWSVAKQEPYASAEISVRAALSKG